MPASYKQASPQLEAIGARLQLRRIILYGNLKSLAAASGISMRVLSDVEHGKYDSLKVTMLIKLCKCLEISPSELFQ